MQKQKIYKLLKHFLFASILIFINILSFNLVRIVEKKLSLVDPNKLIVMQGIVTKQEEYFINRDDIIFKICKNDCLSTVRYTKILLNNNNKIII